MPALTSLALSVTGVLNGQSFSGNGTLSIDASGTKSGNIVFAGLPGGWQLEAASIVILTGRSHIGATPVLNPSTFIGPTQLLGAEFESFRMTTFGSYGTLSVSERAVVNGPKAWSQMITVGELKLPRVRGMGPLRETIRVSGDDMLVSEGRYSLRRARGRSIPVHYTHFYRTLKPNRRLFRRLQRAVYILQVKFDHKARGRTLIYRSQSEIRRT
ncbi:MAG: hypothetical protein WCB18_06430 [Thermoplasmata archaeon]